MILLRSLTVIYSLRSVERLAGWLVKKTCEKLIEIEFRFTHVRETEMWRNSKSQEVKVQTTPVQA